MKKSKRISPAVRAAAIASELPVADIAKELGVTPQLIYNWRYKFKHKPAGAPDDVYETTSNDANSNNLTVVANQRDSLDDAVVERLKAELERVSAMKANLEATLHWIEVSQNGRPE